MSLELKDKKGKKGHIGFLHAFAGLIGVWKSEWNFRFHSFAALLVIIVGFMLSLTIMEWVLISFAVGLVLISELINTAIEKTIDYLKPEYHPSARFIKDAAAGAVLVSAIVAVVVGLLIFLPKINILL